MKFQAIKVLIITVLGMALLSWPKSAYLVARPVSALGITPQVTGSAPILVPKPPVAPVRPVTDNYGGTKVSDPYRWMEAGGTEFEGWLRGQNAYTRASLARIPGRDALAQRIRQLDRTSTTVSDVTLARNHYFYLKAAATAESNALYTREGLRGPERLLFDPACLDRTRDPHFSIDYYTPSRDGRYVAYGLSQGGSEESTLFVREVSTGRDLKERIARTRFGGVSWRADGRSFFYNRLPPVMAGTSPLEAYRRGRAYLHVVGTPPELDVAVWGYQVSPRVVVNENDTAFVSVMPGSPFVFGTLVRGVQNEIALYAVPLRALDVRHPARTPWRKVADFSDEVTSFDARGNTVYLLTHRNASRFKIIAVRLAPDGGVTAGTRRIVVPESRNVVRSLNVARDALYVTSTQGGIGRLLRLPFANATPSRITMQRVPLPYEGALDGLVTDYEQGGALFMETSWTRSALWYRYAPRTGRVEDTGLKPLSPVQFTGIVSEEVLVRAPDGTPIPLSIVHRRDLQRDGSHPTLLEGYGAYGVSLEPYFVPSNLAWLERGGVLAYAHVRGGGEGGEAWHQAGMKSLKTNTINDFIACAESLVAQRYTSPRHLAATGGSAGGITVGRAFTRRPELFGAVVIDVGVCDALRSELSPSGPANIPEFGTFTTRQGFHDLYEMDSYLHVRDGVKYPAVLLTTGANDPRVASWEPAKMTARLQAATKSGKPVLLRVDYDAGHGIGSTKTQEELAQADTYAFLWQQLAGGFPVPQPLLRTGYPHPRSARRERAIDRGQKNMIYLLSCDLSKKPSRPTR